MSVCVCVCVCDIISIEFVLALFTCRDASELMWSFSRFSADILSLALRRSCWVSSFVDYNERNRTTEHANNK
jgi:hypothetical protein